jgi:hypothetical protein
MSDMMRDIERIGRDVLDLPTLESRNSDELDFHALSVWQIREALCAAYRAGINCVAGEEL